MKHGLDWDRDDIAGRYASINWLKKAEKQIENPKLKSDLKLLEAILKIKSALEQLERISKEQESAVYEKVRKREKRKKS